MGLHRKILVAGGWLQRWACKKSPWYIKASSIEFQKWPSSGQSWATELHCLCVCESRFKNGRKLSQQQLGDRSGKIHREQPHRHWNEEGGREILQALEHKSSASHGEDHSRTGGEEKLLLMRTLDGVVHHWWTAFHKMDAYWSTSQGTVVCEKPILDLFGKNIIPWKVPHVGARKVKKRRKSDRDEALWTDSS